MTSNQSKKIYVVMAYVGGFDEGDYAFSILGIYNDEGLAKAEVENAKKILDDMLVSIDIESFDLNASTIDEFGEKLLQENAHNEFKYYYRP